MDKKAVKIKIGFIISGLIIIIFAAYMLIIQVGDYKKASRIYDDTTKQYVKTFKDTVKNDNELSHDKSDWAEMVDVDLAGLCEINEDIVGWIYFENLDISYPVLFSGDDSTYLRKSYTGENVQAGSIFMEGKNTKDFSDSHTIIYGHNMKDLSMFGKLKYYVSDNDYILGHEYFQIITAQKKYRYKIFSYKVVPADSAVYTIYKVGNQEFLTFANSVLREGSYLDNNDIIKFDDHLITLSTCSGNNRLIVSAVRCDEEDGGQ